jgi:hypothetical protein
MTIYTRIKLTAILAMAIFPTLVWTLALSETTTPLVHSVGIYGCVSYAGAISMLIAWLLIILIIEIQKLM